MYRVEREAGGVNVEEQRACRSILLSFVDLKVRFRSRARSPSPPVISVESKPSQLVGMDEALKPTEKNGFTVIDVTPDKLTFTLFMWRPPQPVAEIDRMKPALVHEVPRTA